VRVYISISNGEIALAEPEDTMSFKVVSDLSDPADLDRTLRGTGWGRLDGDAAMISVAAVERAASGRVPLDWVDRFGQMLDYARTKGWVPGDGDAIQAHVELRSDLDEGAHRHTS
jgi:hypothetical protein